MKHTQELTLNGKTFTFETGRFAKQADGAVMVQYADTMVLAAVVCAREPREGVDFFPLQVEYREKTAAAGKIPGGFFKREGRPSEREILSARLIDRPIRPMFPKDFRNETQVIVTVYSSDRQHDGDVLGACAASAALMVSDVPFDGPVAEVRVGRVDGQYVINPTYEELDRSDMDVTVAGTDDSIVMVEGEAKEISEADMIAAINVAHSAIRELCRAQVELAKAIRKAKREIVLPSIPDGLVNDVKALCEGKLKELSKTVLAKEERSKRTETVYTEVTTALAEKYPEQDTAINGVIHDIEKESMRWTILDEGKRLDGRGLTDIRPITIEVGLLPRTHGSALFTRGETQSLTTATLGTKMDEQILDGLQPETSKRFMLHYNFPPFSVGETGRLGSTSRREIGHGNLAERALRVIVPDEKTFPYTLRIVSDILESNGSSSMATVCAGSLALFDSGVPMPRAVAGIAMGLVKEKDKVAILSDILGNEDHLGDMDFKVAGTEAGITAFQMDIKIKGISFAIMEKALAQAKAGRLHILKVMSEAIGTPRAELSKYAPRLQTIKIPVDMIGAVIGPGGKIIRHITAESGAEINIEDDGTITIAAVEGEAAEMAIRMINDITQLPEVGKVYTATVKKIMDFGAFVEILPGREGLVHVSQLDVKRVEKVEDMLKVGDEIQVKLMLIDDAGKMSLSRKALLPGGENAMEEINKQRERRQGDRGRSSGHGRPFRK
ncbi:MAG: polyribonucleotide nucleotidyltransferase [Ignavibacteria bacterium GWA2_55_11]|nr:MAG: polyribonucleotide nucleotidyltransferase [Ignavibacteria bacterium GWA2_55_11]OGU47529.1 MAG: polyribonucleotide nucleotidyltransferase [Ignavibacteria bacterium GWC2_56_12]OGU73438.1 MAG: polyribonucleotide nucleotidyltransferase [Ignavibacteria bacterium RIFCSPLOWO2_12_FULL_56_21]HAV23834.1 polyribonucleotide nucleotidyltransferase [Bacteroidota bacterium]